MKSILTLLFLLSISLHGEVSDGGDTTTKYIYDLRKNIESKNENFAEYFKLEDLNRKSQLSTKQKLRYEELVQERVATHKQVIKLREHLRKGRSVLDYPGILALGKIKHNVHSYELTISAGARYGRPASLSIRFDNAGKILSVHTNIVTK